MFKIQTLEPKKHKKMSVVFDQGFQRICYNQLEDLILKQLKKDNILSKVLFLPKHLNGLG